MLLRGHHIGALAHMLGEYGSAKLVTKGRLKYDEYFARTAREYDEATARNFLSVYRAMFSRNPVLQLVDSADAFCERCMYHKDNYCAHPEFEMKDNLMAAMDRDDIRAVLGVPVNSELRFNNLFRIIADVLHDLNIGVFAGRLETTLPARLFELYSRGKKQPIQLSLGFSRFHMDIDRYVKHVRKS